MQAALKYKLPGHFPTQFAMKQMQFSSWWLHLYLCPSNYYYRCKCPILYIAQEVIPIYKLSLICLWSVDYVAKRIYTHTYLPMYIYIVYICIVLWYHIISIYTHICIYVHKVRKIMCSGTEVNLPDWSHSYMRLPFSLRVIFHECARAYLICLGTFWLMDSSQMLTVWGTITV